LVIIPECRVRSSEDQPTFVGDCGQQPTRDSRQCRSTEVDQDIAAEHQVKAWQVLPRRLVAGQVELPELDHSGDCRVESPVIAFASEVVVAPFSSGVAQRPAPEPSRRCGPDSSRRDIGAEYPDPIGDAGLATQDRQRVCLLAAGTAGTPDAEWRRTRTLRPTPEHHVANPATLLGFAQEVGLANRDLIDQAFEQVVVAVESCDQVVQRNAGTAAELRESLLERPNPRRQEVESE